MQKLKPILLVEDDSVDAMTVRRAFMELQVANELVNMLNGEEALEFLRNESNQKPCLILLDLNMPKMNGIEFLKKIKADAELKRIPAVMLTTSRDKENIAKSFSLGAAGYMVKPVDYKQFMELVKTILEYWKSSKTPEVERGIINEEPQTHNVGGR